MHPNNIIIAKIPDEYIVYIDLLIKELPQQSYLSIKYSVYYNETLIIGYHSTLYRIDEKPINISYQKISVEQCFQILDNKVIDLSSQYLFDEYLRSIKDNSYSYYSCRKIVEDENLHWELSNFCYEKKIKSHDLLNALKNGLNNKKIMEIKDSILNPEKRMQDLTIRLKKMKLLN